MKFLGWMLLLSVTGVHAQEVIESTPLSVQDDGTRQLTVGKKDGSVKLDDKEKEVIKVEAVEVKPESLEEVSKKTKKDIAKDTPKDAPKKALKKMPAEISVQPVVVAPPTPPTPPAPVVNPQDGQLKLESAGAPVNEIKIEDRPAVGKEKVSVKVIEVKKHEAAPEVIVAVYESSLKKYLQFSFGYINSRYEKVHSSLDNGSGMTSFRFVADMTNHVQSGFAVEILTDTSSQKIPDNIRVLQYRVFGDYHAPILGSGRFDWIAGLAFSAGDFGIKRRFLNNQGQEVSVKLKDGTIIGLIPSAGVRIYLIGKNSFDLAVEYHQYFGKPQSYIGGLAIAPRLSFEF